MKNEKMKKAGSMLLIAAFAAAAITGCKKDDNESPAPSPDPTPSAKPVVELSGTITADRYLDSDTIYLLKGYYVVSAPAVLTIEPGTIVKGDKPTKGALIIGRGARILAEGTASNPIIFTSNQPAGSRGYGDWSGVILCGRAPVNQGTDVSYEGGAVPDAVFGGTDPADNSGKLKYIRIEFAGIAINPNQEINGLTLGGVGSGTEIEHIQVSYSGDDSFEMFGGTVNLKNIIAFKGYDDDFDTDFGYSGSVQFAVALRDPNSADVSGSNGFESDNDASGTAAIPYTAAKFSNVSLFGALSTLGATVNTNHKRGAHIRRNSHQSIYNSVIAGFPTAGLVLDGSMVEANAANNEMQFRNNVISGCPVPFTVANGTGTLDANTWYNNGFNTTYTDNSSLGVNDAFNLSHPDFLPGAASPLLTGADFTGLNGFTAVTFRGAFGATDWTAGWANFDPQNTTY